MTICRYCMAEVSEREIEAEDGCCPECGAVIAAGAGYLGQDDEFEDEFDEMEEDEFSDFDDENEDGDYDDYDDDAFLEDDDSDMDFSEDLDDEDRDDEEEEEF